VEDHLRYRMTRERGGGDLEKDWVKSLLKSENQRRDRERSGFEGEARNNYRPEAGCLGSKSRIAKKEEERERGNLSSINFGFWAREKTEKSKILRTEGRSLANLAF